MYDLHSHTSASDGALSPEALLARAVGQGVTHLSITDHDTVAGYDRLEAPAELSLIPGIEFSTRWQKAGIHVLGLNVDLNADALTEGVAFQQAARIERGARIAEKLRPILGHDCLPAVQKIAAGATLGRPHFATHLVESGAVSDPTQAFHRYLGRGKVGDVRNHWAPLEQIVDWINRAGGIAVIAHPAKYGFTNTRLRKLFTEFSSIGGGGIEVVSGKQPPDLTLHLGRLCRKARLLASCGSDFHRVEGHGCELGQFPTLPSGVSAIWESWDRP